MAGYVYHVRNRAKGRLPIFHQDGDAVALEPILGAALEHVPGRRLRAYGLLANPWHLLLTHTQRWHAHSHGVGRGHLSQGRFQSLAVARDEPFLRLGRYGEQGGACRAGAAGRGLALVQLVATATRAAAGEVASAPLAAGGACALVKRSQTAANGSGPCGPASQCAKGTALWR